MDTDREERKPAKHPRYTINIRGCSSEVYGIIKDSAPYAELLQPGPFGPPRWCDPLRMLFGDDSEDDEHQAGGFEGVEANHDVWPDIEVVDPF